MNLATVIAVIALVLVVFFAVRYLVKEKKKGNVCIGCPYAGSCTKKCGLEDLENLSLEDIQAMNGMEKNQNHES